MARELSRLTAEQVSALHKPGYHADGAGLCLQISRSGTKSWLFRFRLANGRRREMGLGALHTVPLQRARLRAKAARLLLLEGIDPIEARRERVEARNLPVSTRRAAPASMA